MNQHENAFITKLS